MSNYPDVKVFAGEKSEYIASRIVDALGLPLGKKTCLRFKDGEFVTWYDETVRGEYVFIVQSMIPPSDNLMELLMMIDAAKRASAYKVIAVIPYFGFARQDRKDKPRVAIGAKLVANMLQAAGVDRVVTMDLHADQLQGFFDIPVDHLYGSYVFIPYIQKLKEKSNIVIASPDIGGAKRANSWAKYLDTGLVICHKTREQANKVAKMKVIGNVKGKHVIIVDDMIDTGGTICAAAKLFHKQGAVSVRAVASHAVLSDGAYQRIERSMLEEVIFTDSIPQKRASSKIKVLSAANMFADTIRNIREHRSISEHHFLF
jgi:ribose-phosphate pyrophosphokinase